MVVVLLGMTHLLIPATVTAVELQLVAVPITAEAIITQTLTTQVAGQVAEATTTQAQRILTTRVLVTPNRGVIAGEPIPLRLGAMTVATTGIAHRSSNRKAIAVQAMNRVEAQTAIHSLHTVHQERNRSLLTALLLHPTQVAAVEVEVAHPVVVAVIQVVAHADPVNPYPC